MVTHPLTACVVGCGRMGAFTTDRTRALLPEAWFPLSHAGALAQHPAFRLTGFCDTTLAQAEAAAEQYAVPDGAFDDVAAMLAARSPDIITVATRAPGRAEILRAAIAHGVRGIHTEKPLCQSLQDSEALVAEIAAAGIQLTYGTIRRYFAPYLAAKRLVGSGRIGDLVEISVCHGANELLLWSHPHSVDLLMLYAGAAPESVSAVCDFGGAVTDGTTIDCDPRVVFARIGFAGGVQGLITRSPGVNVVLTGTEGMIRVVSNGERLELHSRSDPGSRYFNRVDHLPVDTRMSPTYAAFDTLARAVTGQGAPDLSPDGIAMNQRLLWAIVTSALEGGRAIHPDEARAELVLTGRSGAFYA